MNDGVPKELIDAAYYNLCNAVILQAYTDLTDDTIPENTTKCLSVTDAYKTKLDARNFLGSKGFGGTYDVCHRYKEEYEKVHV